MSDAEALAAYSRGDMTALELRRRLGGATYGEVLLALGRQDLPLPRAFVTGREQDLRRARDWLFHSHDA